jgi:hypothetical protein
MIIPSLIVSHMVDESRTAGGSRRRAIIALALSVVMVGCASHSLRVESPDREAGSEAAVSASGGLVPEIREESIPKPATCMDTSRVVSLADSGSIYPPAPIALFVPPLPIPNNVRGFRLVAEFEVSSCGATLVGMSRTPNAKYNRLLQESLRGMVFRPGVGKDGKPVRARTRHVQVL